MLNPQICYEALRSRDERFDGRIFVGVTSTGIYCRPVCPVVTAKFEHCRFYPSAAAAQEAGFRPCLRCRPETAPDGGTWRGTSSTVSRGLALIAEGQLDGDGASVDLLAERLGIGERQLRRLFQRHLGASPVAVAQTRRVLLAKQLIHDTRLPMTEVALAAGFGSVRRFNETFRGLFRRPPTALRRRGFVALHEGTVRETGVTVRLRYRPPYDWSAMLSYLRDRSIDGVETVKENVYARTLMVGGECGIVEIAELPKMQSLAATIRFPSVRVLPKVVDRIRRAFDLDTDVSSINAHLRRDPLLAGLIGARPGLRVPGGWDGFELGVRAILGQGVSVQSARRLVRSLVETCGRKVHLESGTGLRLAFPTPAQVRAADLSKLGVPAARRQALVAMAAAALRDPSLFQPLSALEATVERLRSLPGVGEWTAHYIALRAARDPDAFPVPDAGISRAVGRLQATAWSHDDLLRRADRWRPWRGYAAQHLWHADALAKSCDQGGLS